METVKDWIHEIFLWLENLGYWGIMLGLMIEIIPSEIVLSYGGYLVSQHKISFAGTVLFGTIGGTIAQVFVYWIGRYGGRPFLEKYGKLIFIHKKQIDVSEQWFNRYGTGIIFTARFIPVVRHAISIPAGMARMPLHRFILYTAAAILPWSVLFIYLGMQLGDQWEQIDEKAAPLIKPFIVGALLLTAIYFIYKFLKGRSKGGGDYGKEGEKQTAHQLKFIGKEYKVLHNRVVRSGGSIQEIDHLVIGPNGVFHIESKNWSGIITFTHNGMIRSNEKTDEDPTAQMYRHEYIIKELLREYHIKSDVVGVLCFTNRNCQVNGKSAAFTTLKVDRLLHHITTYRPRIKLSQKEVLAITKAIKDNSVSSR